MRSVFALPQLCQLVTRKRYDVTLHGNQAGPLVTGSAAPVFDWLEPSGPGNSCQAKLLSLETSFWGGLDFNEEASKNYWLKGLSA